MNKEEKNRQDAEKAFITDRTYKKGHLLNSLHITWWVIIGWIAVAIPIYWTITSTILRDKVRPVWSYAEGVNIYYRMDWLFLLAAIVIVLGVLAFTFYNNYKIKHHINQQIMYDQEKVQKRAHVYDDLMTARFGSQASREEKRYYEVPEEKNLDTEAIRDAYEKANVGL